MNTRSGNPLPVTITETAKRLRDGTLSSESLTRACLKCIKEFEPMLKAFITITADQALETAGALDAELKAGKDRGILHGIPIVHKDLFDTAGVPTTMGSEFFRHRVPIEDATVVRLLKDAGTVTLGKATMSEFAAGGMGMNIFYGDTCNPWDLTRVPGGSSSGTAVAIAAGLCLGGTGSDTSGSIRIPSSLCGIVGIRPTYGRVSLAGVFPRAYSLDSAGPMARTVADAAILLNAMAGYDPRDPNSFNAPREDFTAGLFQGVRGLKLGIIENYTFQGIESAAEKAMRAAVETFAHLGAEIITVEVPVLTGALDYNTLFSNILQYEFNQILGEEFRSAPDKDVFGPYVQNEIQKGVKIDREVYQKTLRERPPNVARVKEVFKGVDALLIPTMSGVAPTFADAKVFSWAGKQRRFNLPISFTGMPSISVPCGFSAKGLPVGLQIVGNHLEEALIVRIAAAFESATNFHKRRPPIYCSGLEA